MTIDSNVSLSPRRPLLAVAATALIALGLAACGSSGGSSGATAKDTTTSATEAPGGTTGDATSTSGSSAADTVVAKDFSLSSVTVAAGAEVTFENTGKATHTMTADDGSFDTGRVAPGSTAKVTAPSTPGSYSFHCTIHPSMTGTLTVTG